jgi:hypothetical protein
MTSHKDVIIAILGAAAAITGLVLVVFSFVLTAFQGLPPLVPDAVPRALRRRALLTLGPFTVGIACIGLSTAWLLTKNNEALYVASVVTFIAELTLLLGVVAAVTKSELFGNS